MNPNDEVRLTIRTTRAARGMLVELVDTGLYGLTIEQAAEELLRAKLREALAAGHHRLGGGAPRPRSRS